MLPLAVSLLVAGVAAPPGVSCGAAIAFTGTVCAPPAGGKHPAILLLGGSEGGDALSVVAPAFAAHGMVAASVAYFGLPHLPPTLAGIPVETVGRALAAVAARDDVDPQKIVVYGGSKGGELALLAACTYPQIHAVIASVPSPFAWQGLTNNPDAPVSSWTVGGKPVPFVPYTTAFASASATAAKTHVLELRPAYDDAMKDRKAIDAAFFPLERIDGPILLLSAGDDRLWNSEAQSRLAIAYLRDHHHPYADVFQNYPLAGHAYAQAAPGQTTVSKPLPDGSTLALGGTEQANLDAGADSRMRISQFLRAFFATQAGPTTPDAPPPAAAP